MTDQNNTYQSEKQYVVNSMKQNSISSKHIISFLPYNITQKIVW